MTTINSITPTTSVWATIRETSVAGATSLMNGATNFAHGAGETLSKIWSAVSGFFSTAARHVGTFLTATKDLAVAGYMKTKDIVSALPREGKIALAVGVVTATVATGVYGYFRTNVQAPAAQV